VKTTILLWTNVNDGISLIRSLNVHDNNFVFENLAHITPEQGDDLNNVIVEKFDVLLNITGASVCRCAITPSDVLPARVNQHVCIIRPLESVLNSHFLLHCLISKNFKRKLLSTASSSGATREALTKKQVNDLNIPTPPIELQNQFADIVQQITDLDLSALETHATTLKASLTQELLA
jgi:type I restriction enzyme S subunit